MGVVYIRLVHDHLHGVLMLGIQISQSFLISQLVYTEAASLNWY